MSSIPRTTSRARFNRAERPQRLANLKKIRGPTTEAPAVTAKMKKSFGR